MPKDPAAPDLWQQVQQAKQYVEAQMSRPPCIGLILGSGMGALAERMPRAQRLAYRDIPHFPRSTVVGHAGELVLGELGGVSCAVLSGRVHPYEGYSLKDTAFAVRVLWALGVGRLAVTNAAGGSNPDYAPGDLMAIRDHINLTGDNPLRGPNDIRFGPRFFDMGEAYCPKARALLHQAAGKADVRLHEGVYTVLNGPSYETPAEVRMLRQMGADAVGMSTVGEVLVARHMGMQVAGLSVITNRAAGLSATPLSHREVTEIADRITPVLCDLLVHFVQLWQEP